MRLVLLMNKQGEIMNCTICQSEKTKKHGTDRHGNQRFRCLDCKKTFQQEQAKPLGEMTLAMPKVIAVLKQLVEGSSVRSTERITGVHRDTILSLLEVIGGKCARLMEEKIVGIPVSNVQCDEIWGFVGQKERTKKANGKESDETVGDAWCFVAIEQSTKLILTYHLGHRVAADTQIFTEKLANATSGNFQINTDGFKSYHEAIKTSLGERVDFAKIVKVFGKLEGEERRYSPPQVTEIKKTAVLGNPDLEIATTSHVERQNLTIRMAMRRMTRLTNAFSKKWDNLNYSYALHFFYYNFMRVHSTLRVTPAMEQAAL
jgi:transposase-like protein/IS1 family transposase